MTTLTSSYPEPNAASGPAVTPAPPAKPVAPEGPGRLVTDAPMRMFHWLFALSFVGAYISADSEHWRLVHVVLGYTLAGLLAFRIVYGLVGPRPARFSTMWRKVSGTKAWLKTIQAAWGPGGSWQAVVWRQAPILGMAMSLLALLAVVLPLTLTGYGTFHEWGGDLGGEVFGSLHEFFGNTALSLVLLHLALLAGQSYWRQKNLALPMLTGRLEGRGPDLIAHNRVWLAVLLLLCVLAYIAWEIFSAAL
ncbi:cytochrome b/b6 domain-containing protein [Limnohabitans sp.]|uniref:cytochrome b/b6 domain-containing protein n=1 Tax=Limnohabitans sp. TaxID=1907725 RepID=UPI0025C1D152|nr:cytochrome b/b6 domain-containing protein [Limnohabitans sp.]